MSPEEMADIVESKPRKHEERSEEKLGEGVPTKKILDLQTGYLCRQLLSKEGWAEW